MRRSIVIVLIAMIMLVGNASPAFAGKAYSHAGDVSSMWDFHGKICDRSHNGKKAAGLYQNGNQNQSKVVIDGNGASPGCNTHRLNFRGAIHWGCVRSLDGCGPPSIHSGDVIGVIPPVGSLMTGVSWLIEYHSKM